MFPVGLLLLLMAGNAPAPAARLSIAPLPALILQALDRPPLPHHHEAMVHLETVGKEYSPDPLFLFDKEKMPMNLTRLPPRSVPLSKAHDARAGIQHEKLLACHT